MIIGLTGGIGSGKTAASDQFIKLGVPVVDSDIIAREVVLPGTVALAAIASHFGNRVLLKDGTLDRAYLRQTIFQDSDEKQWLEDILHPLIRESTVNQLAESEKKHPYTILASPLLLETDQYTLCDAIVIVDISEELQIKRASLRDQNSTEQIKRIIATQTSRKERLAKADYVLDNSGSLEHLIKQVNTLDRRLRDRVNT